MRFFHDSASHALTIATLLTALISGVVAAEEGPDLKIHRDESRAQNWAEYFLWSSVVSWGEDIDKMFPDPGHIAQFSKWAYDGMIRDKDANHKGAKQPSVMTALTYERDIFFSSSVKGALPLLYSTLERDGKMNLNAPSKIREALIRCQQTWEAENPESKQKTHRNQASCGEVMTLWQLTRKNPNPDYKKIRIVTWGRPGGKGEPEIMAPCGTPKIPGQNTNKYGCMQLLKELEITKVIGEGTKLMKPDEKWQPTGWSQIPIVCEAPAGLKRSEQPSQHRRGELAEAGPA